MMYVQVGITIFIQGLAVFYVKMSEGNEKTQTGY